MTKSWLKTVDAWHFERPLASLLGAAGAFMVLTIPAESVSAVPMLGTSLLLRVLAALIVGLLLGGAGFAAMRHPWPKTGASSMPAPVDETPIDEEEEGQLAAAEISLRLRRSDRHPDAPARAPIFASRDLGAPFMEVGAFTPPPAEDAIPEGDYAELAPETDARAQSAAAEDVSAEGSDDDRLEFVQHDEEPTERQARHEARPVAPVADDAAWPIRISPAIVDAAPAPTEADAAEPPAPIAAFAPEEEPVPSPARAHRASLGEMMERLSAGLEQRAAGLPSGVDSRPQGREPALREALEELNRLAARRG